MSDRPTLFAVVDAGAPPEDGVYRPASRADLLAALDVEWWCMESYFDSAVMLCSPAGPHRDENGGSACHWAVKS